MPFGDNFLIHIRIYIYLFLALIYAHIQVGVILLDQIIDIQATVAEATYKYASGCSIQLYVLTLSRINQCLRTTSLSVVIGMFQHYITFRVSSAIV